MNILVLYKEGNKKGGLLTNTKILAEGLRTRGINTVVMGTDGVGTQSILKDLDVHVVNFSSKNFIKIYREIAHIVKTNNIDVIHAQNRIPALYASVVCFFHKSVKYVWSNLQVPIPYDFFHRVTTKYGDRAITACIDGFKMLTMKMGIPKEKVCIVNLGVNIDEFVPASEEEKNQLKKKYGILEQEKVILLYGSLIESKGHMFFLQSLEKVNNMTSFRVVFPGEGTDEYKKRLINYAKQMGIEEKLIFPGFVNGREILSIADLMVLPSKHEGFPISCIEAYCMGIPVIRTKTGGFEDTKKYCTGIDFGDTSAFANELTAFFREDKKFKEKAEKALKSREQFSSDYMINQYINIYHEIIYPEKIN